MTEYNLFAGVDENFRFPPEVRAALLESLNIRNLGEPMTTAQRNAIPTAGLESGYYIFNTDTQSYQVWRIQEGPNGWAEWHDGLESPGSQKWWAGPTIPPGWKKQNGASLLRQGFSALFKALNTTYGGSETPTHFKIPNTSGRTMIDANTSHPLGQQGGKETVKLDATTMPKHKHTGVADHLHQSHQHGGTTNAAGNHSHYYWWITDGIFDKAQGGGGNSVYFASRTYTTTGDSGEHYHAFATDWRETSHSHTLTIDEAGGDGEHENMMPFQAGHFIIKY